MLEIDGLTKRYGPVVALDGASFTAAPGRIVGFLGPNGAGKTTTMRCIFGLARPDAGAVRWAGRPVDRDARLRFGYMPEQRGLYPRMRVAEQLGYFAQQHGMRGRDADAAAMRWLERMGLADRAKSKLEELSHGNQQRDPAGDRAGPRSGAARHGRAVLGPRSDRHRDDDRCRPGARGGRRRGRVLQPPAGSRRGHLRGRGRSSPAVASSRPGAIEDLKAAAGRRHLEVEVAGSDGVVGGRSRRRHRPRTKRRAGEAPRRRPRGPRRAARAWRGRPATSAGSRTGRRACRSCSWRPSPTRLRRTDAAPTERRHEPASQHLAGRAARDHRAGPQPRIRPVGRVHDRCSSWARSSCRPILFGGDEATPIGVVQPAPADLETAHRRRRGRRGPGHRDRRRIPDRAAGEAALEAETIDVLVDVPRGPLLAGEHRLRRGDRSVPAIAPRQRVVGAARRCRARRQRRGPGGPRRRPGRARSRRPSIPRPIPRSATFLFANIGTVLIFIGIFSFGFAVLTGVVEEKQSRVVEVGPVDRPAARPADGQGARDRHPGHRPAGVLRRSGA